MSETRDQKDLQEKIEQLRRMVLAEDGLCVRTDDNFMLRYLRCCGNDPEAALKRIKTYYGLKYNYPSWFATSEDFSQFNKEIDEGYNSILQGRDREGKRIYVVRIGGINPSKSSMARESKIHDLYMETILDEETTQKCGICAILDVKNYSLKILKWLTPGNLRIAVMKTETLPAKKIDFHIVNPTALINSVLKVILPFLSSQTKENIYIHRNTWSLLQSKIDPQFLPKSYGGHLNSEGIVPLDRNSQRLIDNLNIGYVKNSKVD